MDISEGAGLATAHGIVGSLARASTAERQRQFAEHRLARRPGERGYSAGAAARIVDLIRERDIRTSNQDAAVPLLEQLWRELAKSDPDGTFAGTTYDLTAGNRLPLTCRSIR